MGLGDSIASMIAVGVNKTKSKPEIEKTKAYIKSKREAFYRNNNLKER